MKRYSIVFLLLALMIGVLLVLQPMPWVQATPGQEQERPTIVMALPMNSGFHWSNIKQGAQSAAGEFNVNLVVIAPSLEEDVDGQIEYVKKALEETGAKALVIAAADPLRLSPVIEQASQQGIYVVAIDSPPQTAAIDALVATDNVEAGSKALNHAINISGLGSRIGILGHTASSATSADREQGIRYALGSYPRAAVVAKEYCQGSVRTAQQKTAAMLADTTNPVDILLALNSAAAEGAALAIQQAGDMARTKIIAFDGSPQVINLVEQGVIDATVLQSPYNIGFWGVQYAVDLLQKRDVPKQTMVQTVVVTKTNMFDPQQMKLVFPFTK